MCWRDAFQNFFVCHSLYKRVTLLSNEGLSKHFENTLISQMHCFVSFAGYQRTIHGGGWLGNTG